MFVWLVFYLVICVLILSINATPARRLKYKLILVQSAVAGVTAKQVVAFLALLFSCKGFQTTAPRLSGVYL